MVRPGVGRGHVVRGVVPARRAGRRGCSPISRRVRPIRLVHGGLLPLWRSQTQVASLGSIEGRTVRPRAPRFLYFVSDAHRVKSARPSIQLHAAVPRKEVINQSSLGIFSPWHRPPFPSRPRKRTPRACPWLEQGAANTVPTAPGPPLSQGATRKRNREPSVWFIKAASQGVGGATWFPYLVG